MSRLQALFLELKYFSQKVFHLYQVVEHVQQKNRFSLQQWIEEADRIWPAVRLTYVRSSLEGDAMQPTLRGDASEKILIRSLAGRRPIFSGDVVQVVVPPTSDAPRSSPPSDPSSHPSSHSHEKGRHGFLFRRVTAVEGDELVSMKAGEPPFKLAAGQYWVTMDNPNKQPSQDAPDSRVWGPVRAEQIAGRAVYTVRTIVDHGVVQNSTEAQRNDSAVLFMELDVDQIVKMSE